MILERREPGIKELRSEQEKEEVKEKLKKIQQEIDERRKKKKMVDLKVLEARLSALYNSLNPEEKLRFAQLTERWLKKEKNKRNLLFFSGMISILDKIFNHRWPLKELKKLRKIEKEKKPISAEILWQESLKSSRALDKLLGRKLAKKLRRKIKKGGDPQEIIKNQNSALKEKRINPSQAEELLKDYEAHYKSWRTFIEEKGEKIESYLTLLEMWQEGEIREKGLKELAKLSKTEKKFYGEIFGDWGEIEAAQRILKEIESCYPLKSELAEKVRKTEPFQVQKKKYERGELSLKKLLEIALKQSKTPSNKLPNEQRWAQVLFWEVRKKLAEKKKGQKKEKG